MKNRQRVAALSPVPALLLGLAIACISGCRGLPQPSAATPSASSPPSATATELGRISATSGSASTASGPTPTPANISAANSAQQQADAQALASQCDSLRADIREAQSSERLAPTTSVDEDIVAAREAKDDQRIADLQQQYAQLGCPSAELPPTHTQTASPPPAPGTPLP
jgi:hypothetical protein